VQYVLTWFISGLVAGWLARVAMKSKRDFGVLGDLTVGSLGALVGGWLFKRLGFASPDHYAANIFVSVIGAAILLGSLRLLRRVWTVSGLTPVSRPTTLSDELESRFRRLSEFERRAFSAVLGKAPKTKDPNQVFDAQLTFGQRVADKIASFGGSWTFIGIFFTGLIAWMIINQEVLRPFDPYPFILLNLVLSCVAAMQAPVIMMSQNRQATKDRIDARSDYEVNLRAEMEILSLHAKLDALRELQWEQLLRRQEEQTEVLQRLVAHLGLSTGPSDLPEEE
jgi:uncharacterized membrane protein/uncharacterized membrane protein YeaQ/YmgE (transglycosylase-associated protein family)